MMPSWRRFSVDKHGTVHIREVSKPHWHGKAAPSPKGAISAAQAEKPTRRVSPCRAQRSALRAADRAQQTATCRLGVLLLIVAGLGACSASDVGTSTAFDFSNDTPSPPSSPELPSSPPASPSPPPPECECQDTWTSPGDDGTCAKTQQGCPATSCSDGGTAPSWCMLKETPCTPGPAGDPRGGDSYDYDGDPTSQDQWMYCFPPPPAPPLPLPPSSPSPPLLPAPLEASSSLGEPTIHRRLSAAKCRKDLRLLSPNKWCSDLPVRSIQSGERSMQQLCALPPTKVHFFTTCHVCKRCFTSTAVRSQCDTPSQCLRSSSACSQQERQLGECLVARCFAQGEPQPMGLRASTAREHLSWPTRGRGRGQHGPSEFFGARQSPTRREYHVRQRSG